jgi:hypothetical protein
LLLIDAGSKGALRDFVRLAHAVTTDPEAASQNIDTNSGVAEWIESYKKKLILEQTLKLRSAKGPSQTKAKNPYIREILTKESDHPLGDTCVNIATVFLRGYASITRE